jgi:hypothetical protein
MLLSGVFASVVPCWQLSKFDALSHLLHGGLTGRAKRFRSAKLILCVEVVFSTVLIVGAGLTGRTLLNLQGSDVGFVPDRLWIISAYLPPLTDRSLLLRQYEDMVGIIGHAPGVRVATASDSMPTTGTVGRPMSSAATGTQRIATTSHFFETLGMRVIAGRQLIDEDMNGVVPVGVLSVRGLTYVWPDVNPQEAVGRFLEFPGEVPRKVVGIVSDVRSRYAAPAVPTLYVPVVPSNVSALLFAARGDIDPSAAAAELARQFRAHGLDPHAVQVRRVSDDFASTIVDQTFRARLLVVFGFCALLLASVGIYAIQAFTVGLRAKEFAVRVSLGASPRRLVIFVLLETLLPVSIGVLIGLGFSAAAARLIESILYGVSANDPLTFTLAVIILWMVAMIAGWIPARRAARNSPSALMKVG